MEEAEVSGGGGATRSECESSKLRASERFVSGVRCHLN